MKKLARPLLILLACLSSLTALAQQVTGKYKLLWEIKQNPEDRPSYLFGTMHLRDERVFNLPDSLILAIEQTDGFALEIDFDAASYTYLSYLYEDLGRTVYDADDIERTSKDPESVQPVRIFEKMTYGSSSHEQKETFLDAYLYRYAKSLGKNICGLETLVSQLQLLEDPEYSLTGGNLKSKLRLLGLIDTYAEGNLEEIDKMINQENPESYFSRKIIVERNIGMAQRADSLIQLRPTFLGVGAAHLPGNKGLIQLLRQKGYQLRPVVATYSGMRSRMYAMPYQPNWQSFERSVEGYRLKVPSRPFPVDSETEIGNIYVGADIPGGLEYGFFSLTTPEPLEKEAQIEMQEAMIKSFVGSGLGKPEIKELTMGNAQGFETTSKRSGQYYRVRTLFQDNRMICLTWSGAKNVVESELADQFFDSVELLEPQSIGQLALKPLDDEVWGFSMLFPGSPDVRHNRSSTFDNGGRESISTHFDLVDQASHTCLSLLVEDFKSPEQRGDLDSTRMEDVIYYLCDEFPEPLHGYKALESKGIKGLEANYLLEGVRYRQQLYLNGNRLYLLSFWQPEEEEIPQQLDAIFASFSPLPLPLPQLALPYDQPRFSTRMPYKVNHWEGVEYAWTYDHDTAYIDWCRDPASSMNFVVFSAHHNEYVNGSNEALLKAAKKSVTTKKFKAVREDYIEFQGFPALRYSYHIDSSNTMHYLFVLTAEYLYELRAQCPRSSEGEALVQSWLDQFQLKEGHHRPDFDHGKLSQLLADADAEDSLKSPLAKEILGGFRLHPQDYELASKRILEEEKAGTEDGLAHDLHNALLKKEDEEAMTTEKALFLKLPKSSSLKMDAIVSRLENSRDTLWAWEQLEAYAKEADIPQQLQHSWRNFLREDSTGSRIERLAPILEVPHLRLQLAYDLLLTQDFAEYFSAKQLPAIAKVLALGVDEISQQSDLSESMLFKIAYMMYLISSESPKHWEGTARKMLRIRGNYLSSIGAIALIEGGMKVDKKTLVTIAEDDKSRYDLLSWMVETEQAHLLPKKYFQPEFLGEVALSDFSFDEVLKIELLEKRKIPYTHDMVLVYRMQVEGKQEWQLGFAGPFPTDAPIYSFDDLYMLGIDEKPYHPVTVEKQVKNWIKSFDE